MKVGESMDVLHSFNTWNYVKYANMEGFCKDSHSYSNVFYE